ncbi:uncharacterized protein LOC114326952 [Diabrotica virgifera virgifera]|uniref:Uncharacterized protein LOC114326952 n=1 Tax=Diabrotica virgifera virgifera TaxID=50390 RepID=A0A6P7F668_DIAVI|nr:uncharacterized protein LOC114326952 [Diabrotica virgifera virgifera]
MKVYYILLIAAMTVCDVKAYTSVIMSDADTEDLGDCYTTIDGIGALKSGVEKQKEGECAVVWCSDNREIQENGCGVVGTEPPCTILPEDLSKPYPYCCESVSCPPDAK